jgi:hypothetical protein
VGSFPASDLNANVVNTVTVRDIASNTTANPGFEVFYDNIDPVLTSFIASPDPVDIGIITLSFTFSEPMATNIRPDVTITTASNQLIIADRDPLWNPGGNIFTVSALITMDTAEGNAGVTISGAKDLAENFYVNTMPVGTFVVDIDLTPANLSPSSVFFTNDITITPQKPNQQYRWYKNNTLIPGQTNFVLPSVFYEQKDIIQGEIIFITGDKKLSGPLTVLSSLPSDLTAVTNPGGNILLSWSPSPNPDVTKVLIFSDMGSGTINMALPAAEVPVPLTSYVFTDLRENKNYKFVLAVADSLNQTEEPASPDESAVSGMPDKTPPVIECISPDSICTNKYAQIIFKVTDAVSGLDLSSVLLRLDSKAVPHSYNSIESLIYYPVARELSQGSHTASLTINDKIGNTAVYTKHFDIKTGSNIISYNLYPNPCRGFQQIIRYELARTPSIGKIKIYDARERLIRSIDPLLYSGFSEIDWDLTCDDGLIVPNGTYFILIDFTFEGNVNEKKFLKSSIVR